MATQSSPEGKPLETASFVVHATRGLIRDQKTRRRTMLIVLGAAVLLILTGSTLLQSALDPHQRPGWFIFFWLVCAWLTMTAILLAFFDLLMVRRTGRKAVGELRKKMERESSISAEAQSRDGNRDV